MTDKFDPARLRELGRRVGSISIDQMNGDNLAILLCTVFENPDQEQEDDTGWTPDAVAGYEATIAAINAHYEPTILAMADENAALKAEVARLRGEITLLKSLPDDIAETVIKLGPVEWGQTDPKDASGHGESVKNSVELTAAHFRQKGLQPMNGLYLVGEDTVVCYTGTSPNSAQVARALTGAWNLMHDHARAALAGGDHD